MGLLATFVQDIVSQAELVFFTDDLGNEAFEFLSAQGGHLVVAAELVIPVERVAHCQLSLRFTYNGLFHKDLV